MIFKVCFLFTESFLKNGNSKEDKRRNGDEREGRKRERQGEEKMKVRAGSLTSQLFSGSWFYLEKKSGVVFCAGM